MRDSRTRSAIAALAPIVALSSGVAGQVTTDSLISFAFSDLFLDSLTEIDEVSTFVFTGLPASNLAAGDVTQTPIAPFDGVAPQIIGPSTTALFTDGSLVNDPSGVVVTVNLDGSDALNPSVNGTMVVTDTDGDQLVFNFNGVPGVTSSVTNTLEIFITSASFIPDGTSGVLNQQFNGVDGTSFFAEELELTPGIGFGAISILPNPFNSEVAVFSTPFQISGLITTESLVPTPGSAAIAGLAGLLATRRRRG